MLESPDMDSQSKSGIELYLASNSPRRKELLSLLGVEFSLLSTKIDETPFPGEGGLEYVQRMAYNKAITAWLPPGVTGVIIAADTAVVASHRSGQLEILGKPADRNEALSMLSRLRRQVHQVFTALSIRAEQGGRILSDLCITEVAMRDYSDEEMEAYVASGDPLDKAGGYAIQHPGFHPVQKLQGCYANVMGLPLCHLARTLFSLGLTPTQNVPRSCQAALGYDCSVYRSLLSEKAPELLPS